MLLILSVKQSVGVEVLAARDLPVDGKGKAPTPYSIVTVDSKSFKSQPVATASASPSFSGASFQFPIVQTTQYIVVYLLEKRTFGSDRYFGKVASLRSPISDGVVRCRSRCDFYSRNPEGDRSRWRAWRK